MGIADFVILAVIAVCVVLAWRALRKSGSYSCSGGSCCGDCASYKGKCNEKK